MQAVIEAQGKQFLVKKGQKLTLDRLDSEQGSDINFDKILLINGDDVKIGTPYVEGASVQAKILEHKRAKKITVFKYKRRKGYHKKQGHRQDQTVVEIQDITAA